MRTALHLIALALVVWLLFLGARGTYFLAAEEHESIVDVPYIGFLLRDFDHSGPVLSFTKTRGVVVVIVVGQTDLDSVQRFGSKYGFVTDPIVVDPRLPRCVIRMARKRLDLDVEFSPTDPVTFGDMKGINLCSIMFRERDGLFVLKLDTHLDSIQEMSPTAVRK